jgi:hypothetical protein
MIFDYNLLVSGAISAAGVLSGQAANGAGNIVSTNSIDLGSLALGGNQVGDLGAGEALEFAISVLTAPTAGTTVKYQVIQADDSALTSNVQVINSTDDIPIANLPAGTIVPLHVDRAAPYVPKRYMGIRVVNVGAIATHSIVAGMVKNLQDTKNITYRSGYAVL